MKGCVVGLLVGGFLGWGYSEALIAIAEARWRERIEAAEARAAAAEEWAETVENEAEMWVNAQCRMLNDE